MLTAFLLLGGSAATANANLILNPDFETADAQGNPVDWIRGRWGTNTAVFSYPVAGLSNTKAAKVALTSRTSGDAKWAFSRVAVTPGKEYEFSDFYKSNVATHITAEYLLSNGSLVYEDLGSVGPSSVFAQAKFNFVVPANVQSLSIFHLINAVGELTVDGYNLVEVSAPPPPTDPNNLISNPSLEIMGAGGLPQNWFRGANWGSHTAAYTYPVAGFDGARAARVDITSYTSGDAKWYFQDVPASAGQSFAFSDFSRSNLTSFITARVRLQNGTFQYVNLGSIGPSSPWHQFSATFSAPANAASVTIFHVIKGVGFLEVDNYSLKRVADPTKFAAGFVSIVFDDGRRSSYDIALPILDNAGLKSSHFIVTGRMGAGFPGFIKTNEVLDIQSRGHEVGSHTRTHRDLTLLSASEQLSEISGSRQDLLNIGISEVKSFAYPFGSFNNSVVQTVKNSGYLGARATIDGDNLRNENPYLIKRESMEINTTLSKAKADIDKAIANKTWLVLTFHQVDTSGNQFSVTPQLFQGIVDYLKAKNVTVRTFKDGLTQLSS